MKNNAARALKFYHELYSKDPAYMERMRLRSAKWRQENVDRNKQLKADWYQKHRAEISVRQKAAYAERTKDIPKRVLLTDAEKKERKREYTKRYREENRDRIISARKASWQKQYPKWKAARERRFKENPEFLLRHRLRVRMKHALKGELKAAKTMDLIGCSSEELRRHIESLWRSNMRWSNYGFGSGRWQLDHVRPLALFSLADHDQQMAAFHYTNLQPLWYEDHLKKSATEETGWRRTQPSPCSSPQQA